MLTAIAKLVGGIVLIGVGVFAAAIGAGAAGDGLTETMNGSSESGSSPLRKTS